MPLGLDTITVLIQCLKIWMNGDNGDQELEFRDIFDAVINLYRMFESIKVGGNSNVQLRNTCRLRLNEMKRVYGNDLPNASARIDYSDLYTQWSYMYVYMLRHIHLVSYALDDTVGNGILTDPEARHSPTVCMIGGGPGTDVLGLSVHLRKYGHKAPLRSGVYVLDKYTKWQIGWELLHMFLPKRYQDGIPQVSYRGFDFKNNELSVEQQQILKKANIVTMIKSLSPVAAWLKERPKLYKFVIGPTGRPTSTVYEWHSVFSILKHMKKGAFLLYIDNRTGPQRRILMDAVDCFNFDKLYDKVLYDQSMPTSIFSPKANQFKREINYNPCTVAGINEVILVRKK
ncbi:hypothetical protein BSL78_24695 [Apostichopus japonicus]|uniref:Uncharacterized protein n=1 Tax=Stichopus japonicus TaxID=307972 RepID=A0A2G8JRS5_STIJA|nr:hypothetical protein BSL78_24695 [Apostichopus japonicus]